MFGAKISGFPLAGFAVSDCQKGNKKNFTFLHISQKLPARLIDENPAPNPPIRQPKNPCYLS
jgi:hypothetical protein